MTRNPCQGSREDFPWTCPNPVAIPPCYSAGKQHNGGIACGCPAETALEKAAKGLEDLRTLVVRATGHDRVLVNRLIHAVRHHDAEQLRAWADGPGIKGTTHRAVIYNIADQLDPEA